MSFKIQNIDFDIILPIWKNKLWPTRQSAIESHSAMMLNIDSYDTGNFSLPVWFYGLYHNNVLVGVNSTHGCTDGTLRLRGFWVDEEYRGRGLGRQILIRAAEDSALNSYSVIWAFPRSTSWPLFERLGYIRTSDWIPSETSDANTYCSLTLL